MACPASATREDGYPNTSSPAAELGTLLHELSALVLVGEMDMDAVRDRVDKRSAEQVEIYVDYVNARTAEIKGKLLVERRFHIPLHEELWGTSDAVVLNRRKKIIEVIDLKTGGGHEVFARNPDGTANVQAAGYLMGALHTVEGPFDTLLVTIVQPRRGGIKTTQITWEELYGFAESFLHTIRLALKAQPLAQSGDHCTFCRAKPDCHEYANRRLIAARNAFPDLTPEDLE